MDEQDQLSHFINQIHHICSQINDRLDVHSGFLKDLEGRADGIGSGLETARRKLERVARRIKENSEPFS